MPVANPLYYACGAAVIAAFLGLGVIEGDAAAGIAQILLLVFGVICLILLIMNFAGRVAREDIRTSGG